MSIYLEVNADGLIVNAITWDGQSLYTPDEGLTVVEWDEITRPWIGDYYNKENDVFVLVNNEIIV